MTVHPRVRLLRFAAVLAIVGSIPILASADAPEFHSSAISCPSDHDGLYCPQVHSVCQIGEAVTYDHYWMKKTASDTSCPQQ